MTQGKNAGSKRKHFTETKNASIWEARCFKHASAQDLSKTVLPITKLKWAGLGVEGEFGTGFCLDPECRLIGTNYHVAMMARPRKIKGERVIQRYLATGPDDEGASMNEGFSVTYGNGRGSSAHPTHDLNASQIQEQGLLVSRSVHGLPHFHHASEDCKEYLRTRPCPRRINDSLPVAAFATPCEHTESHL